MPEHNQTKKTKTILFDLDGTLTDTMHSRFKPYRDGQGTISMSEVAVFPGAKEVVNRLKADGNQVFIVSDSHPKFVQPIAKQIFGLEALSLAYKPSVDKTKQFIEEKSILKLSNARSRIFMIGDTTLDIHTARKLGIPSVHMIHESNYQPENWASVQKSGPTYSCKSFDKLFHIITEPLHNLLVLEGQEFSTQCKGEIKIGEVDYKVSAGKRLYKIALARQETGPCDRFGKAKWYFQFSRENRTQEFLKDLASGVARYIDYFHYSREITFDILSFVPDKRSTKPPKKMEIFTELVDCGLPIQNLMKWKDNVEGSIRHRPQRRDRIRFVKDFVEPKDGIDIRGKNIIVIDDQITTGATAEAIGELLQKKGANHILFIALFQMIEELSTGKKCNRCGKEMSIRMRRSDGNKFYSCIPERYGGVGCGNTQNIGA